MIEEAKANRHVAVTSKYKEKALFVFIGLV